MENLFNELRRYIGDMPQNSYDLSNEFIDHLHSIYPFNKFEYIISHLIATGTISLEQYLEIRDTYIARNKYLYIFEIDAPRSFGETWAQRHLNEVIPELSKPSKRLDPDYSGEYDFWLDGIKIEVKASRAVRRKSGGSLIEKALSSDSDAPFDMNFQQIKPACCDVFVWIGVWRDAIKYWVLSSDEVKDSRYFSAGQHRGNTGEGQLWIKNTNIAEFHSYEAGVRDLLEKIREKARR